jgi:ATP/maltotriose-dependent transcriptional regulator MalT
MVGVGKTTLAARLVRQTVDSEKTFWHSFHESEGVEAVVWRLAGFLYWRGKPDLWCMLQGALQTGGQPPPTEVLLDYLMQMVRGQGYTLCLDDLHLVDDDPLMGQLAERFYKAVAAGDLSLVVISRRVPEFVPTTEFEPLTGLNVEDTRALLAMRGLVLPDELVDDLHSQTEGNAQMLSLTIETLKRSQNPRLVIGRLAETDDIERYLMTEVDTALTEEEREMMSAVSVLMGYPGTRDAIEAIMVGSSVRRILGDLTRSHLLAATSGEHGREYSQHATVRAFYYDLLGRRERQELHRRAGAYYESEEPDTLKAGMHYERGSEFERAARLVTSDIWTFINQGRVRPLRQLLERFTVRHLDTELWSTTNIARGQVYAFVRESQLAQDSFQEALSSLATLPDTPEANELRGRACRGMGALLEYEAPREALEWLDRGLRELDSASIEEEAALRIKIGSVHIALGEFTAALSALQEGLALLPEGPSQLRARALANLGTAYATQGDIERGNTFTLQGLEISQQLNDYYQLLVMQSNLGIDKDIAGDWDGAATDYRQALAVAEQLGSVAEQVRIESNLGFLYTNQGDSELATSRLAHALELARKHSLKEQLVHILSNLADLHLRQEEPEAAKPLLAEAERVALDIDSKYQLPEIYRGWARVQLANGQPGGALVNAERSVNLARELGLEFEEGMSLRVLGRTLIASDQEQPGVGALKQSLALLEDDPYEAARTKTAWGRYLVSDTHVDLGKTLLNEAHATFEELGAKQDLAVVAEILKAQA